MQRQPDPIPDEVKELFDYLMTYAHTGNLGLISTLDRDGRRTRFTLFGRHPMPDGGAKLVPLGFLSTTAGDEVLPPGEGLEVTEFILAPDRWDEFVAAQLAELDRWADDGGPAHD